MRAVLILSALLASGPLFQVGAAGVQLDRSPPGRGQSAPSVTLRRIPRPAGEAACTLPAGPLPTQDRAVFILDTSASMRGVGDGQANIFEGVKAAINTYVRAEQPDRVDLVTFDSGPRLRRGYAFPDDRARWNAELGALRADGRNTYLYRSVAGALAPLRAGSYATTVFVLTDGIDNDPDPGATAARALAAFGARGPLDALYYVALGTPIPADAQAALRRSGYAQGLSLPTGQLPRLGGLGSRVQAVTDPARVPLPWPNGTPLTLIANTAQVRLPDAQVRNGAARLEVVGRLPGGTPALLCATSAQAGGVPRRVLLRLDVQPETRLTWLNPGAGRTLRRGETVTLRYRLERGAGPVRLELPPGLGGEVQRLPGGRALALRLTNLGLRPDQEAVPTLTVGGDRPVRLPVLRGGGGSLVGGGASGPGTPGAAAPAARPRPAPLPAWERRLAALLGTVLVLGGLLGGLGLWRRRRPRRGPLLPPAPPPPSVEGLRYSEDRTLGLVGTGDLRTAVPMPLGGPFDLGQLARVPHLSGLRLQQDLGGLRVLRLPEDLEVSQGARLLREGDVVRPGTLLGVTVARRARSPHRSLGGLAGLGLPLRLRADGVTLHVVGPYGEHTLTLRPGVTDLGEACGAPALRGLKLTPSGPHLLLAVRPSGLVLRRAEDGAELHPGTYLPALAQLELPEED